MINIRIATITDAGLIADMSRLTFYDFFATQNTKENMDKFMNEQFTKEALMQEVGAERNIFLLAYDGEQPVGYVRMRENNIPPELGVKEAIEIARIYAIQSVTGKGVGSALMQKCIDIATEKKCPVIWLGVWKQNKKWHRVERSYGSFARTFALPDDGDAAKVNAEFKDGMLKVRVAKSEAARPKQIEVKVS